MNRRGGETPMDFAWDNKLGPVDPNSPFISYANQQTARKRTHAAYDSPTKSQAPNLRPPNSQASFLFSQTPAFGSTNEKPLPTAPTPRSTYKSDAFTTPRKMEVDYSSGGETPETPQNDSLDNTPDSSRIDRGSPTRPGLTFKAGGSPGKPEKRMSFLKDLFKGSPKSGKGAITKHDAYSKKAEKRHKRRIQDSSRKRRTDRNYEDSDDEAGKQGQDKDAEGKGQQANGSIVAGILSFIDAHPTLPHILSIYAQFIFNLFLVLFAIYVIWSFWSTITSDVSAEAKKAVAETLAEMAVCAQNYRENRCDPKTRMPALASVCSNWEKCMDQDPEAVGRARVGAHTFARVLNSFVEPISYKAMIFTLLLIFGSIAASNFAFAFFRNRQNADMHGHPNVYTSHVPPTPHRQPSGSYMIMDQPPTWQTPYGSFHGMPQQHQYMGMEPAPSATSGAQESPTRRRLEYK